MNEQNVFRHFLALTADYAQAACDCDYEERGFSFVADGYTIEVFRAVDGVVAHGPNAGRTYARFGWRIKNADGLTVKENENNDQSKDERANYFSETARDNAWVAFSRLTPMNDDGGIDDEVEGMLERAYRRVLVSQAWRDRARAIITQNRAMTQRRLH